MNSIVKDFLKEVEKKKVKVDLKDYEGCHHDILCKGDFKLITKEEHCYMSLTCEPVLLHKVPMVKCEKCGSGFIPNGVKSYIENAIALNLLIEEGLWTKRQTKFLREFFEKTPEEIAGVLNLSGRSEVSKKESSRFPSNVLSVSDQYMLRCFYAELALKKTHTTEAITLKFLKRLISLAKSCPTKNIIINDSFVPSFKSMQALISLR